MKKRKIKHKKSSNSLKYLVFFLIIAVFSLSGVLIYLIIEKQNKEQILKQQLTQKEQALKILQQKVSSLEKNLKKEHPEEKHQHEYSEIQDYASASKLVLPVLSKPEKKIITITPKNEKPKLVIIIDDMSYKYQVKLLKEIPFKITPSFFPPTKSHPNTAIYANRFTHYMVHLPMEALNYSRPEPNTLNVGDSYAKIEKRIKEIKKIFPNAKFINNHTGSKFTGDYQSMYFLFKALKAHNLGFVDSRTTPKSQAAEVEKRIKIPMFSRNIFLDNKEEPSYIRNQLKKAVNIAKKYGYAIAIGHPHKITLTTLKNSKDLLSQVEVVYIDELKN
ncbi:MAG: divergent polysaccharide deacetylase family protein [Nautiliaceae bacterium]